MRTRIGLAISLAVLTLCTACQRQAPEKPSSSAPPSRRPSPIDEELPRPAAIIAEDSVRTRVAEAATSEKKSAEPQLGGTDWAVVAAIYKEYEPAERRARQIASASTYEAGVFPPKGQGAKYMVVLGSGLTQAKAREVRDRAVSDGLPSDTYVTRLIRDAGQSSAPAANPR